MSAEKVVVDSPAVLSYLTLLQSAISRMATNSTSCKTWCISLVSAIIVIVADKGKPNFVWISVIPIMLFFFLDSYYLCLELRFRKIFEYFVEKMHAGTATMSDVFLIAPLAGSGTTSFDIVRAGASIAVWPFYTLFLVMLLVVKAWVL